MKKHYVRPFNASLLVFLVLPASLSKADNSRCKAPSVTQFHKPVPAWPRWLEAIMNDMGQIVQRRIESLNLPLTS